jgi:UDPglucose 6-dehydrogenase
MTRPIVGYAGMTHLGLCSAISAASKGFETIGFDLDARLTSTLAPGRLPVLEPGLDDMLRQHQAQVTFTSNVGDLARCDLIYVAPDIPTDGVGQSDLTGLDHLLRTVLDNTREQTVVVILSQVPPGFTRSRARRGRPLYSQVETLIFGRAVERATHPERFIIGASDPNLALPPALDAYLQSFDCPILPMRFESAELCKIAINCCLVASITVANTLAEVCEQVGADWSELVPALKLDRRIGSYAYLSPGLGLAGGNLERDLATVIRLSETHGTDASLIKAFVKNSNHRKNWALRTMHETILSKTPDAIVGVLGLAYKENTHSVKNSSSLALIRELTPYRVQVYDPVLPASEAPHPAAVGKASALEAATGADVLAVMTPWPQFKGLSLDAVARAMRGNLVLDPYRMFDSKAARAAGLDWRTLGVS